MNEYQELYRRLFDMIMSGQHSLADGTLSPEAKTIHERMNAIPASDRAKATWGMEVGRLLYQRAVYGDDGTGPWSCLA